MWPSPRELLTAFTAARVNYALVDRWDDASLSPYKTGYSLDYGILHHTAGVGPGVLEWVQHNEFDPVRACHFLVDRNGLVNVVTAWPCYHAGAGGPGSWAGGPVIPADVMNQHAYGLEIESLGTSLDTANGNGYTPAQVVQTARVAAAVCHMMGWPPGRWVNHSTWAGPRKGGDTLHPDAWWQERIAADLVTPIPTTENPTMDVIHVAPTAALPGAGAGDYLLGGGRLVGITASTKAASTLPTPRMTVVDPEQWSRLIAAYGTPSV